MHDIEGDDLLFIPHVRHGRTFFVLTSRRAIDGGGSVEPLWFALLSRRNDLPDLVIWFGEHRGRWPQWRQIVEDFGFDALNDEVTRLQSVVPIQEVIGVAVDRQPDPLTIAFRADLVTRRAIIARHRFASSAELEAFLSWQDQADAPSTWQLIQTACLGDRSKLATRMPTSSGGRCRSRESAREERNGRNRRNGCHLREMGKRRQRRRTGERRHEQRPRGRAGHRTAHAPHQASTG